MHTRNCPRGTALGLALLSISILLFTASAVAQADACPQTTAFSQYEGRYRMPDGSVLIV